MSPRHRPMHKPKITQKISALNCFRIIAQYEVGSKNMSRQSISNRSLLAKPRPSKIDRKNTVKRVVRLNFLIA